jgi:hypothetical protein
MCGIAGQLRFDDRPVATIARGWFRVDAPVSTEDQEVAA